jgi:glucosamine-6-phosphate deaminase
VISMGGILRKLWENENAIVVAYMTSGNIAVFDHDVRRHLDFVERAAEPLGLDRTALRRVREAVEASFERKAPGDVDVPLVQDVKRMIRESEAIAALEALGLPRGAARFLSLPFYRTGEVRKRPIGPEDVAVVRALLEDVRPDLAFVAGDLSDPHGTHRMCKAAVERALEGYGGPRPEVWLYRPRTSRSSSTSRRRTPRRSRVPMMIASSGSTEARNLEAAAHADRLGLAEYYAMGAYRILKP